MHIDNIILAEFDIETGSKVSMQYPKPTDEEEHLLAELMLPDGAHQRQEDWSMFMMSNRTDTNSTQQNIPLGTLLQELFSNPTLKKVPIVQCDYHIWDPSNNDWTLVYDHIYFALTDKLQLYVNLSEMQFEYETAQLYYRFIDDRLILQHQGNQAMCTLQTKDERIILENYFVERNARLLSIQETRNFVQPLKTRYVINIVSTKRISGISRGARTKALALVSKHPFIHVFKPLLVVALDRYFQTNDENLFHRLFDAINNCNLDDMPLLSCCEKKILCASEDPKLFAHRFQTTCSRNIDKRFFDCGINFENILFPIKVPISAFAEELGNYSIIDLVSTFSKPESEILPKPRDPNHPNWVWHPDLDHGEDTHPIIILINAILTQKRVMILGHTKSSQQVCESVLAACALASGCGSILRGFTQRCFPYICLSGLERLLITPGFIAGVNNPVFQERAMWWDVLFDLSTGKVHISNNLIAKAHGIPPSTLMTSSEFSENYISEIKSAIHDRMGEAFVRQLSRDYIQRIVDLTATYEIEHYGSTNLQIPPKFVENRELGHGTFFASESAKKLELASFVNVIKAFKSTLGYQLYCQDLRMRVLGSTVKNVDFGFHMKQIAVGEDLSEHSLIKSLIFIKDKMHENPVEATTKVLVHFPQCVGNGIDPLGSLLLHPRFEVRMSVCRIIQLIGYDPVGAFFVDRMNPLLQYAALAAESAFYKRKLVSQEPIVEPVQPRAPQKHFETYFTMIDSELGNKEPESQQKKSSKLGSLDVIQEMIQQQSLQAFKFTSSFKESTPRLPDERLLAVTMDPSKKSPFTPRNNSEKMSQAQMDALDEMEQQVNILNAKLDSTSLGSLGQNMPLTDHDFL